MPVYTCDVKKHTATLRCLQTLSITILAIFFLFCTDSATAEKNNEQSPNKNDKRIRLKKRQFTPQGKGMLDDPELSGHVIIQFEEFPNHQIRQTLKSRGIKILQYVPDNGLMVYIPQGTELTTIPETKWAGKLQSADKISKYLHQSLDKGFALVDVYPDVDDITARGIFTSLGAEVIHNPYLIRGNYLIIANRKIVNNIANQENVSWIFPASDAVINAQPVYACPGPMTEAGPVGNYATTGEGWDGPGLGSVTLNYHFENGTPDITGNIEETEVERAMAEWANYASITWTETPSVGLNMSVDIKWATLDHGDGAPFDGLGGILAHCFFPAPPNPETIAGDLHFDEAETWRMGSDTDLFSVALHELGHGLGLDHSSNTSAVMYSYYQMVTALHTDDINGIQSLYETVAQCSINAISPTGGCWGLSTSIPISWTSTYNQDSYVDIDLYEGTSFIQNIATATLDDGSHNWTVDPSLLSGCNYRIKISVAPDPACFDFTPYFCVAVPPDASSDSFATYINNEIYIQLNAADEGCPGALTYSIQQLPANGTLNDTINGEITGTPYNLSTNTVAYTPDQGYTGADSFTFAADDGGTPPAGGISNIATVTVNTVEYYTELFDMNNNDLDGVTLTFVPDGSNRFYSICSDETVGFPTDTSGSTTLVLSDDDYAQVNLTGGKLVSLYGTTYSSFYVSSNGYITFASPDTTAIESLAAHFAAPRISALFDDLDPFAAGTVSTKQLTDRAIVTFDSVPEKGTANSNTFQIEMFYSGTIRISYLNVEASDGLSGLSDSSSVPTDFVESDLTAYGFCADINDDYIVDANDFIIVMDNWMDNNCAATIWCNGTDLDRSGTVDIPDIAAISRLYGRENFGLYEMEIIIYSNKIYDGRVWDDAGGLATYFKDDDDTSAGALKIGDKDYGAWYAYRTVLSFDTGSLPDDAVITKANIKMTRGTAIGTDPFTWGGQCLVDIASPYLGMLVDLEDNEWYSAPDITAVAQFFGPDPGPNVEITSTDLSNAALNLISTIDTTQFMVRFENHDSGAGSENNLGFYPGETSDENLRPKLVVQYLTATPSMTFNGFADYDGRVWDDQLSAGGVTGAGKDHDDDGANALRIGDVYNGAMYSYRSILSFDTSLIPDSAQVTGAKLQLTRGVISGSDPFIWGGQCLIDIASPFLGTTSALEFDEWYSTPDAAAVAEFLGDPGADQPMISTLFDVAGVNLINKTGTTQFKLRMSVHDSGSGSGSSYLGFYPNEATTEAYRPKLTIDFLP